MQLLKLIEESVVEVSKVYPTNCFCGMLNSFHASVAYHMETSHLFCNWRKMISLVSIVRSSYHFQTPIHCDHRSSHQSCSFKKGFLKNVAKFTGKHICQNLFFNKVAGLRPLNSFLQNTSAWLLLRARSETPQILCSDFVERSWAVVITTTPLRHISKGKLRDSVTKSSRTRF